LLGISLAFEIGTMKARKNCGREEKQAADQHELEID